MKHRRIIMVLLWSIIFIGSFNLCRRYVFISAYIPTNSMAPTLLPGDYVFAKRFITGQGNEKLQQGIQRKDILLFSYPYAESTWKMGINNKIFYVKRCVALPGDTIRLNNMSVYNPVSNIIYGTDTKDWIPFYVPSKGDTIKLTDENYDRYWRCIDYETNCQVEYNDSMFIINGRKTSEYIFRKNYYFVIGENMAHSQDSRHWGLLPEDFIMGKVLFVWNSIDPLNKKLRNDRLFKKLM